MLLSIKAEHIEVDGEVAFNLDDIFSAQLAAAGIFDECHAAIELIELQSS